MGTATASSLLILAAAMMAVTGCGSRTMAQPPGSVAVKMVSIPSTTTTYEIRSSAMEPTLHCARPAPGCERAFSDRIVVRQPAGDLKRGGVVVFRTPPLAKQECGSEGIFVKRLIGLPGDVWEERDGYVYINGRKLNEPYIRPERRDHQTLGLVDIPPHSTSNPIRNGYLMMGDNRNSSCDSRRWGLVPRTNLSGTVVQIIRTSSG